MKVFFAKCAKCSQPIFGILLPDEIWQQFAKMDIFCPEHSKSAYNQFLKKKLNPAVKMPTKAELEEAERQAFLEDANWFSQDPIKAP